MLTLREQRRSARPFEMRVPCTQVLDNPIWGLIEGAARPGAGLPPLYKERKTRGGPPPAGHPWSFSSLSSGRRGRPRRDNIVRRRPLAQVVTVERGGDEVGEAVGRAG